MPNAFSWLDIELLYITSGLKVGFETHDTVYEWVLLGTLELSQGRLWQLLGAKPVNSLDVIASTH